jgi:hypothetical protein
VPKIGVVPLHRKTAYDRPNESKSSVVQRNDTKNIRVDLEEAGWLMIDRTNQRAP